jgi:hypothetical protein
LRPLKLHLKPTSPTFSLLPGEDHHPAVWGEEDFVDTGVKDIPNLQPFGQETLSALGPAVRVVRPLAEVRQLKDDFGIKIGVEAVHIAAKPGVPGLAHDLDVLF